MTKYCKWCGKEIVREFNARKDNFEKRVVCRKGTKCYKENKKKNLKGRTPDRVKFQSQYEFDMELTRAEAEKSRQEALRRGLVFDPGRTLSCREAFVLWFFGQITPLERISNNHLLPYGSDVGGGYGT